MKNRLLIIEDDELLQRILKDRCTDHGKFDCYTASSGAEGLRIAGEVCIDIVLLDLHLPDMSGKDVLERLKEEDPYIEIVIITGHGTIELAVELIKSGAADFLTKPVEFGRLFITLQNILEKQSLLKNLSFFKKIQKSSEYVGVESEKSKILMNNVGKASESDTTILIQGESGTGKEVIARMIHNLGKRKNYPLVKVDCAVIHDTLIQSELFGHEKGAFTGAANLKRGKIELGNNGTLFFDEIADLKENMQGKFLRIIQEKEFERVGGVKPITVDIRIIAATNRSLKEMVEDGEFREDLFYRLNVIVIDVPPLRERKEDIPVLAHYFFGRISTELNKKIRKIDKKIFEAFENYHWPGNVRELKNVVERLLVYSENGSILFKDLPGDIRRASLKVLNSEIQYKNAVKNFKKEFIERSLSRNNWNVSETAKLIGLKRTYLYSLIEQLKIRKI